MSLKHGPWHELTVRWSPEESEDIFVPMELTPVPEGVEVKLWYDWEHPASCGRSCHGCGTHPDCGIDFDILQIGPSELIGKEVQPGVYKARHWSEVWSSHAGTEYTTGIEIADGPVPHDHPTRDIKPHGVCLACDLYCQSGQ